jgi:hypothetical protein
LKICGFRKADIRAARNRWDQHLGETGDGLPLSRFAYGGVSAEGSRR